MAFGNAFGGEQIIGPGHEITFVGSERRGSLYRESAGGQRGICRF